MQIDGSCHCGRISFRAEADPERVRICHCADCQSLSGSAFRVMVPVAETSFELLSGTPRQYIKRAESGRARIQAFCGDCGSAIYATTADDSGPRQFGIRIGTLRQKDQLVPKTQYWCRSAQNWLSGLDDIPAVETQ